MNPTDIRFLVQIELSLMSSFLLEDWMNVFNERKTKVLLPGSIGIEEADAGAVEFHTSALSDGKGSAASS